MLPVDSPRWDDLTEQADLVLADATREIAQPADLLAVAAATDDLKTRIQLARRARP